MPGVCVRNSTMGFSTVSWLPNNPLCLKSLCYQVWGQNILWKKTGQEKIDKLNIKSINCIHFENFFLHKFNKYYLLDDNHSRKEDFTFQNRSWIVWLNNDVFSEFLNTSSAAYLASDRLMPGPEQQAASEAELRRQEVLRQMRDVSGSCHQDNHHHHYMKNYIHTFMCLPCSFS